MSSRKTAASCRLALIAFAISLAITAVVIEPVQAQADRAQVTRFRFKIDAMNPQELLPPAPETKPSPRFWTIKDLADVPEIHFQDPRRLPKIDSNNLERDLLKARKQIAHQIAKINFLNKKRHDHFMEVLLENRPDLAGLPFLLGEPCRLKKEEREQFAPAVLRVRDALRGFPTPREFWGKCGQAPNDLFALAALTQMLPAEPSLSSGFIGYLARSDRPEATQALARLAIFADDCWIRLAARTILQRRDTGPATDVLRQGLRYPWPAVARNTIDTIVQLQRTDLAPELTKMLEEPDPRAPMLRKSAGKTFYVVRELVRVNHQRNCLLCHPPTNTPDLVGDGKLQFTNLSVDRFVEALTGAVPATSQGLGFYDQPRESFRDLLVRADVTYLRQDFSLLQTTVEPDSLPSMQRFDFLVRQRVLTDKEARAYLAESAEHEESPYHRAARRALQTLAELTEQVTGHDATAKGKGVGIALGGTSLLLLSGSLVYGFRRWKASRVSSSVA